MTRSILTSLGIISVHRATCGMASDQERQRLASYRTGLPSASGPILDVLWESRRIPDRSAADQDEKK